MNDSKHADDEPGASREPGESAASRERDGLGAPQERIDELRDLALWLERDSRTRRERISRYLHDDPLQLLAAAKLRIETMARAPERISRDNLELVADQVQRALRGVRELSVELRSAYRADDGDLPSAIESVAWRVEARKGGRVAVAVRAERQPSDDELCETVCEVVEELLIQADGSRSPKLVYREGPEGELRTDVDAGWSGLDVEPARRRVELHGGLLETRKGPDGEIERVSIVVPAPLVAAGTGPGASGVNDAR